MNLVRLPRGKYFPSIKTQKITSLTCGVPNQYLWSKSDYFCATGLFFIIIISCLLCDISLRFFLNNTHAKISASSLAESTSINPKQCRKLKLSAKR